MGNYLQTDMTYYVYRRVLSTDEWVAAPLQCWTGISTEDALSQFKHEVYSFSLSRHTEYEDTKSIYLYRGSQRLAKALREPETRQVEVWSSSIREWMTCDEKLATERYPMYDQAFFQIYLKQHAWINSQTITFIRRE